MIRERRNKGSSSSSSSWETWRNPLSFDGYKWSLPHSWNCRRNVEGEKYLFPSARKGTLDGLILVFFIFFFFFVSPPICIFLFFFLRLLLSWISKEDFSVHDGIGMKVSLVVGEEEEGVRASFYLWRKSGPLSVGCNSAGCWKEHYEEGRSSEYFSEHISSDGPGTRVCSCYALLSICWKKAIPQPPKLAFCACCLLLEGGGEEEGGNKEDEISTRMVEAVAFLVCFYLIGFKISLTPFPSSLHHLSRPVSLILPGSTQQVALPNKNMSMHITCSPLVISIAM